MSSAARRWRKLRNVITGVNILCQVVLEHKQQQNINSICSSINSTDSSVSTNVNKKSNSLSPCSVNQFHEFNKISYDTSTQSSHSNDNAPNICSNEPTEALTSTETATLINNVPKIFNNEATEVSTSTWNGDNLSTLPDSEETSTSRDSKQQLSSSDSKQLSPSNVGDMLASSTPEKVSELLASSTPLKNMSGTTPSTAMISPVSGQSSDDLSKHVCTSDTDPSLISQLTKTTFESSSVTSTPTHQSKKTTPDSLSQTSTPSKSSKAISSRFGSSLLSASSAIASQLRSMGRKDSPMRNSSNLPAAISATNLSSQTATEKQQVSEALRGSLDQLTEKKSAARGKIW